MGDRGSIVCIVGEGYRDAYVSTVHSTGHMEDNLHTWFLTQGPPAHCERANSLDFTVGVGMKGIAGKFWYCPQQYTQNSMLSFFFPQNVLKFISYI